MRGKHEAGFTLIELSFVALLLALLGAIVYGTITTMVRTKNALEERRVSERTAEALLTRISRELENRYAEGLRKKKKAVSEQDSSTEQSSDEAETVSMLLGRSLKIRGNDADSIRFITLGNPGSTIMGNSGVIEVEYRLEPGPAGQAGRELFNLVREEVPADLRDEKALLARDYKIVLSDHVRSLQFRYRFNRRWVNQWSNRRENLPDAVEITLVLATESGGSDTYRTAVSLFRPEGE